MPNYNHGPSLELTLTALRAQAYAPIEILFVDDCSTDDSVAVARSMGVTVLRTPTNSGPAAARNLGAAHARGDVLLFVDSDVAVDPDTVRKAVELLADPRAGAVCGMLAASPLVRDSLVQECRCLQAHYWRISAEGPVSFLFSALCAMRAEVFAEIGPFDERLRQTEEVEYGQRLSGRYEVRLTSAMSGRHRDDARLWPLLRKVADRCRQRVPLYARRRQHARGFETASRAWGGLAALGALVSLAGLAGLALAGLPLAAGLLALLAVVLFATSIACDAPMYRFVLRRRGPGFGLVFVGVQFTINSAIAVGALAGAVQWLLSPPFRRLYDDAPRPARADQMAKSPT